MLGATSSATILLVMGAADMLGVVAMLTNSVNPDSRLVLLLILLSPAPTLHSFTHFRIRRQRTIPDKSKYFLTTTANLKMLLWEELLFCL